MMLIFTFIFSYIARIKSEGAAALLLTQPYCPELLFYGSFERDEQFGKPLQFVTKVYFRGDFAADLRSGGFRFPGGGDVAGGIDGLLPSAAHH